ncbi:MAG: tRNA (adenosine(37)-N6)-threonylcarbamoyltransferase complex dimerization subunit type 1 TsaB [Bacteroidales bacterium]|jgi:tRNA threonylcarbamoyladenosine biosynthesis protein TsaB
MCYLLCIETSTEVCSVALAKENQLVAVKENHQGNTHAEQLMPFVDSIVNEAGINVKQLDAVAVSEGPGSYTGLRIGVSTAKGLCYVLNKPLISVSTLQSMAWGARKNYSGDYFYCPMIDARRMEVYCAVYDSQLQIVDAIQNKIIYADAFGSILDKQKIVFSGNAVEKCKNILALHHHSIFSETKTSAAYMLELAYQKYIHHNFENLAYFEPFYLKEFVAGKPHVKGL